MVRPKNRTIWKHFRETENKSATCKYCDQKYKVSNLQKLAKHLQKCPQCPENCKQEVANKQTRQYKNCSADMRNFVYLIKQHPIIYKRDPNMTLAQYKAALKTVWAVIATKLGKQSKFCIDKWMSIKYKYAKLKNLINTGNVDENFAMCHQKISRYLDGTLSFLDPYLENITMDVIPASIHKHINSLFGLDTPQQKYVLTHAQIQSLIRQREIEEVDLDCIDTQYFQDVIDDVIKRKLREPKANEHVTYGKAIPDPNNTCKGISVESKSNRKVEDVYDIECDSENDDKGDNDSTKNSLTETHIYTSTYNIDTFSHDDDYSIENSTGNIKVMNITNSVSNSKMRKVFNELGEVLSFELSTEKQAILKKRINNLVKELL